MKMIFLAVFASMISVSLTVHTGSQDQDKAALQGRWRAVEATSNGEPPPAGMLERLTLVFNGDTVSIMGAPPTRFTIDPKSTPARIDILNSRHQVGIY